MGCLGSLGLKGGMQERNQEKGILNQLLSEQGIEIEGLDKAIAKCKKNINRFKNRPNKLKNSIAKLEKLNEIKKIADQIENPNKLDEKDDESNLNEIKKNIDQIETPNKLDEKDDESNLKYLLNKAGIEIEGLEKAITKCKKI